VQELLLTLRPPTNGGTTPAYQWQVNGVNTGSNSVNFSSSSLNNNDTVRVILTSSNPCASPTADTSNLIVISVTPTVAVSVSVVASATSACQGAPLSFTATPTNGGTTPVYQWQVNSANAGANSPNFSSSSLANGDTVAVILTSNATCPSPATASDSVFAVITPTVVPSVSLTETPLNPVCATTTINFTATPANGGASPSYQWQVNGVNVGSNSPNYTASSWNNNDTVTVTMTSNAACAVPTTASASLAIVVVAPTVTASAASVTVCPGSGDSLFAVATPTNSSVSWSPAAGLSVTNNDTTVVTQATPGTYTYVVTASFNGCTVKDSVTLTVNNFTPTAVSPSPICYGDSALLFVNGGTSWNWLPNTGLSCDTCQTTMASPSTNPTTTTSTTYSVIVSNGVCSATVTETVTVIPNASPAFTTTVLQQGIPQVVSFADSSKNATGYFWNFGNGNTSVLQTPVPQYYPAEGTYTVTLIAYGANGCNDTTQTVLMVTDTNGVVAPNIFTPNGDDINDVWKPSVHGATSLECVIYDRWGIQIYEFVNAQDKWDGHTTAGIACTEGTYYYILKATTRDNKSYNLKGFIQLIR
jgi:gliding motility-associated-like protein